MNQNTLPKTLICMALLGFVSCAHPPKPATEAADPPSAQPKPASQVSSGPNLPKFTVKEGDPCVYLSQMYIRNGGKYPHIPGESVAEFINRIGGIAPLKYAQSNGRPFDLISGVTVRSDSYTVNPSYSFLKTEHRRKFWSHKLKPNDMIFVHVFGIFPLDDYPLWKGPYRDEWLIADRPLTHAWFPFEMGMA